MSNLWLISVNFGLELYDGVDFSTLFYSWLRAIIWLSFGMLVLLPWKNILKLIEKRMAAEGGVAALFRRGNFTEEEEFEDDVLDIEDIPFCARYFSGFPKEDRGECGVFQILTTEGRTLQCQSVKKLMENHGVFVLEGGDRSVRLKYENIDNVLQ